MPYPSTTSRKSLVLHRIGAQTPQQCREKPPIDEGKRHATNSQMAGMALQRSTFQLAGPSAITLRFDHSLFSVY